MDMNAGNTGFLTISHRGVYWRAGAAILAVTASVAMMALAAQARFPVPGTEVPATLQSFVLLLVAFVLPAGQAFAAMTAYLTLGLFGAPVFASGSPGIWGPTGGFLVGFALCAPLIAFLRGSHPSAVRLVCAGLVGFVVLFALGNLWRWGYWSQFDGHGVSLAGALATGLLPFAPKALVEILLAASLVCVLRSNRRTRSRKIVA